MPKTDPSVDALIAAGQVIEFYNPRGLRPNVVKFPAFLTDFRDTVTANYEEHNVYARMDPIFAFQNTTREITFSIDVPAYSAEEAEGNFAKIKSLQRLLYASYAQVSNNVNILTAPPLFQIKFNNLIADGTGKLMGVIDSLDFSPVLDMGMFYVAKKFFPKVYSFSCTFKPLHSSLAETAHVGAGAGSAADLAAEILAPLAGLGIDPTSTSTSALTEQQMLATTQMNGKLSPGPWQAGQAPLALAAPGPWKLGGEGE